MAESTRIKYPMYQIDEHDAHTQLALLSMCYIAVYLRQSQRSGVHEELPQGYSSMTHTDNSDTLSHPIRLRRPSLSSSDSYPLLAYVQSYGFQHLEHVGHGDKEILRSIDTFQSVVRRHPSEWERLRRRSSAPWPRLTDDLVLYILTAFAPAPLLCSYIGRAWLKPKDGTNPLICAAAFRKIEHARILLSRGVSLNQRGLDTGPDHHRVLPLEVAVRRMNYCMVDLFLKEGSPVPHALFEGAVRELPRFSARIVSRLLQTDEFVEWAAIAWNERRFQCLLDPTQFLGGYTSEEDLETNERRLVQIGRNPSSWFDETSLRHAVLVGHVYTVKRMLSLNIPLPPDIILNVPNSEMMSFLLSLGCDVHVVSPNGDTPLHLVMNGWLPEDECLAKVRVLVGAGCDPFACNLAGETPLHAAAGIGSVSIVEYLLSLHVPVPPDILLVAFESSMIHLLLDEGADVHATAANGDTVLHVALSRNCHDWDQCLELANTLMGLGCDPCSPNVFGETPFHVAAKGGHFPVVQYLLSLNVPLPSSILLPVVGSFSPDTTQMIKFLIDKGADIHATSPNGDTLLGVLVTKSMRDECLTKVKILMNAGCDAHACNAAGETLFHVAAGEQHIPVLEYLLSLDIPVPSDLILTQFDKKHSLGAPCYQTIRFLLDNGADIHTVAENGDTLLHLAARVSPEGEALGLVKLLVDSGCNPYLSNVEQETPLHVASQYGYISVISYLLSLGLSLPSDILLVAMKGFSERAEVIRYLIQEGANISAIGTDGATPLHLLFVFGFEHDRLESAKILIDAGCNPQSQNLRKETPMHLAAMSGYISILEYFLSQGIPLPHDILFASTAKTIRFLLDNGIVAQSIAGNGDTRLLHRFLSSSGTEEDCLERVRILVGAAGWNPSEKKSLGETLMHDAARRNYISIVKYLLSQNASLPNDILLSAVPTVELDLNLTNERIPLLHLLICEGADTNVATWNENTLLHLVMQCNITPGREVLFQRELCKCAEILLDAGSDPYARNGDGKTALDFAEEKGEFFKENFLRLVQNSRSIRRS